MTVMSFNPTPQTSSGGDKKRWLYQYAQSIYTGFLILNDFAPRDDDLFRRVITDRIGFLYEFMLQALTDTQVFEGLLQDKNIQIPTGGILAAPYKATLELVFDGWDQMDVAVEYQQVSTEAMARCLRMLHQNAIPVKSAAGYIDAATHTLQGSKDSATHTTYVALALKDEEKNGTI